ncbi:hypothetical protein ABT381_04750 [Streptomyces sp. NPDC000151]|uniref:hypothetical protein n=1 Tax=Streptomyces sp. NPDC000151 TaxID=3154244 RepID=UPI003322E01C
MWHPWRGAAARGKRVGWEEKTYRKGLDAVRRNDPAVARRYLERLLSAADAPSAAWSSSAARGLFTLAGLDAAEGLLLTASSRYAASAGVLESARNRAERDGDEEEASLLAEFRDLARSVAGDLAANCGVAFRG